MSNKLNQILKSPLREIRTAGSARGDGFKREALKAHLYPPQHRLGADDACSAPSYGLQMGAAVHREMAAGACEHAGWHLREPRERNPARVGRQPRVGESLSPLCVRLLPAVQFRHYTATTCRGASTTRGLRSPLVVDALSDGNQNGGSPVSVLRRSGSWVGPYCSRTRS